MRPQWLLALPLIGAVAQSSSSTADEAGWRNGFSIGPPPASWVTGEPYTTIGRVTPTNSIAIVTTTIQMFPTDLAFVATGVPATPRAPDHTPVSMQDPAVISGVPGYMFAPLREITVKQSTSFEIDMGPGGVPALCWYPISV